MSVLKGLLFLGDSALPHSVLAVKAAASADRRLPYIILKLNYSKDFRC